MTAPENPAGLLDPPGSWQGLARAHRAKISGLSSTLYMFAGGRPCQIGRKVRGDPPIFGALSHPELEAWCLSKIAQVLGQVRGAADIEADSSVSRLIGA